MNIGKPFIDKPIMTILFFTAIIAFSIGAYLKLPVSDLPAINFPVLQIETFYPGANAENVANTVTKPIEKECLQIQGLENITSTSSDGYSIITLTFPAGEDANDYMSRLQQALDRADSNLPILPNPPQILETNPSSKPVMFIIAESEILTEGELYDIIVDTIADRISTIQGVSLVSISGTKSAVRVQLNPVKLSGYNIDSNDIANILKKSTVITSEGSLNGPTTFTLESTNSQLTKAAEYNDLIIKYIDGAPLKLEDIGSAHDSTDNELYFSKLFENGEKISDNPLFIVVYPADDANNIEIADKIKNLIKESKSEIPDSINLFIANDRSTQIVNAIDDITFTLLLSFMLVIFTLFIFLGRVIDTIIPSISLIPAVIVVFLVMYFVGYSINILTLMSIILAIGFVIDDAIVVHENSFRLVGLGYSPKEAAIKSSKDLSGTVISTSIALIVVFLPLFFMSGITGLSLREFAGTVIIAITASSIVALTFLPMLCSQLIKPYTEVKINKVQAFCNFWIGGLTKFYGKILIFVLKYKFISLVAWVLCIGGTAFLFTIVDEDFIPVGDSAIIRGEFVAPLGTSTTEIKKYQESLNNVLKKDPNILHFITMTGESPDADQSTGSVTLFLKPENERESIQVVAQNLREKIERECIPIATTFLAPSPFIQLPTTDNAAAGADYSYLIVGSDTDTVNDCADELTSKLQSMPEFNSVQNSIKLDMPKLQIHFLRDKLYSFGLTIHDVEEAISNSFAKKETTDFTTEVDQYDVYIEVKENFRTTVESLDNIHIRSPKDRDNLIPLSEVASWNTTVGPQEITHSQKQYTAVISFNLSEGTSIGDATTIIDNLAKEMFPTNIKGLFEGSALDFQESISSMGVLILISIFLLYIVLGMLYESFVHPMTVLSTLPLGAFGALLTLVVCSSELSLYAYIGIFLLLGNIAKNGIIMIDFANQLFREENLSSHDAIYRSCLTRLRPILMTGLTTIMAAMPFAIGIGYDASSRQPLGLVIVGGYLFGTLITLFVTPGFYLYMQIIQTKFLDKFEFSRTKALKAKEPTEK